MSDQATAAAAADQVVVAQDRAAAAEARAAGAEAVAFAVEAELARVRQQVGVFARLLVGELTRRGGGGMRQRQAEDLLEHLWDRASRKVERMHRG